MKLNIIQIVILYLSLIVKIPLYFKNVLTNTSGLIFFSSGCWYISQKFFKHKKQYKNKQKGPFSFTCIFCDLFITCETDPCLCCLHSVNVSLYYRSLFALCFTSDKPEINSNTLWTSQFQWTLDSSQNSSFFDQGSVSNNPGRRKLTSKKH